MTGGQFYTVLMQQTNKRLPRRLAAGKMKEKQKAKCIKHYRQKEVLFIGYAGCGKSALIKAVVHHHSLITCSLHRNGEIVMILGVGKGKPLGSYPAKFNIVDSAGYNEEHGILVKFFMENRAHLRKVFLLVDASKGLNECDHSMIQSIADRKSARFAIQPILTKADLIEPEARGGISQQIYEVIQKTLPWAPPPIMTCTRKDQIIGIEEIRRSIAQAVDMPYEEAWKSRNGPTTKPADVPETPESVALDDVTNRRGSLTAEDALRTDSAERTEHANTAKRTERTERTYTAKRTERTERTYPTKRSERTDSSRSSSRRDSSRPVRRADNGESTGRRDSSRFDERSSSGRPVTRGFGLAA
ncbi:hypothetical protein DAEQUDRAFT_810442 [Daedalea quercina L-15889]|uniref:G domain-containing protein n=1 Tax=Daedalea quercina L-15889 TaxID=1314783 RepID=A0A165RK68_9APHY|nr:hypothetical protein DAEQUDRAFT_810442 [Daedalea quercina L-15889]